MMSDRLELIKQRHKKIILEPRKKSLHNVEPDFFFDDEEDYYVDDIDEIRIEPREDAETEFF
jgi:hypothetical protein